MSQAVIIVGGGMAGTTLALAISALTHGQLQVHLVEAVHPQSLSHPGFDARAIALAAGTCQQLTTLGLWSALADCATPITQVQVSDRGHAGFTTLNASDYALPALGQVVELHAVGQRLFERVRQASGIILHCPAKVTDVTRSVDGVSVTLSDGQQLQGALLVAADGTGSPLASQCGIDWQIDDYRQIAVIANVTTQMPHAGRAWERFTAHGPLAMLPMSDGRSSLVWCHPAHRQAEVARWSDAQFIAELQRAFGWRLGKITRAGARHIYPLALTTARQPVGHRLALVGNAAQTLHPIAGQGFNLGMRDVMSLAECLSMAQQDPGAQQVLAAWQKRRTPDREATMSLTHGLVTLFSNRHWSLVAGRNLGLMAMNVLPPARDALAFRTLGWVAR